MPPTTSSGSLPIRTSSIQESKALTGNIEAGRKSRKRRHVTSGPLTAEMRSASVGARSARSAAQSGTAARFKAEETQGGQHLMPATGILHRYDAVHRLQGVRSRVQAMEPAARRWLLFHRHVVRQHRPPRRLHVAARGLHRTAGAAAEPGCRRVLVAVLLRRLQALRQRAGCLESCPTGAIIRTEFDTVYVQPDICNGCGYCVVNCPFGVIDRRAGRRPRLEVHALLRPAAGRHDAGLRQGVPHGVDPIRRARRPARASPRARREAP